MTRSDLIDGLVFLYYERLLQKFFGLGGNGRVARILVVDPLRAVAHVRLYASGRHEPEVEVNHIPIGLKAVSSSIWRVAGVKAQCLDSGTEELIGQWQAKYERGQAGYFNSSVHEARRFAIEATDGALAKGEGLCILTAYPVKGTSGRLTAVEAIVGKATD